MIHVENVTKTFGTGTSSLQDVTLHIDEGEFVFLVGPSGSGKTSLLRMLIRDVLPTSGTITVNDLDVTTLAPNKIPHLRKQIGVVFQDLKLLMDRTIFENVSLPLQMTGEKNASADKKVDEILLQVGIAEHRDKFPIQLSGGELQRAAIARALVFSPSILLADEPTGNLDGGTSWEIVKLLQDINKTGTTIIMATHNTEIVNSLLKRVITLDKGQLIRDEDKSGKKPKKEKKEESDSSKAVATDEEKKSAADSLTDEADISVVSEGLLDNLMGEKEEKAGSDKTESKEEKNAAA